MFESYTVLYDNKPCRLIIVVVCTTSSRAAVLFTRSPDTRKHSGEFFSLSVLFLHPYLHQYGGLGTFFLITVEKPYRNLQLSKRTNAGPTPIFTYFIHVNIKCLRLPRFLYPYTIYILSLYSFVPICFCVFIIY